MNNKEYQKNYRITHEEEIRQKTRLWRRLHRSVINTKDRARSKQTRYELKMQVMELLGGAYCKRCGFSDIRALQIDHIDGHGNQDPVVRKHGETYYRRILREGGAGLQVLCANCNWIKRYENHEL